MMLGIRLKSYDNMKQAKIGLEGGAPSGLRGTSTSMSNAPLYINLQALNDTISILYT